MSDPETKPNFTGFEVSFRSMSMKTAAELKVSSLFSASASGDANALLFDTILHTDFFKREDLNGFSYYKKKGCGLRIALKAMGLDAKASINFASVAAQATLKKASVEYHVRGLALSPDIVSSLLTIDDKGGLTSKTYQALQDTISVKLPAYLRSNDLGVSEYYIPIPADQDSPSARARSINYAASMVAQRKSLAFANQNAPKGISSELITLIYARFLGGVASDSSEEPTADQARSASHWLTTGAIG